MTPKQLIRRSSQLTQAHHDFAKGMGSYAFYKVSNHDVSDDLVQETFMKTWGYLVREGKIGSMKSFLYHILNQIIIDGYRKRKTASLDVLLEKGFDPFEDNPEEMASIFDGKLALILLEQLPVKYRQVMHMRYVQGLSLKEISLITGQTPNAVGVQAHRGLEKLKTLYKDQIKVPISPKRIAAQ